MNNEKLKLEPKIKKYYQLIVVRQWKIVLICWLTLGIFSFWELRAEFKLWAEYFIFVYLFVSV